MGPFGGTSEACSKTLIVPFALRLAYDSRIRCTNCTVPGCLAQVRLRRLNRLNTIARVGSRSLLCWANSKVREGERVLECVPIVLAILERKRASSAFATGAASHPYRAFASMNDSIMLTFLGCSKFVRLNLSAICAPSLSLLVIVAPVSLHDVFMWVPRSLA